MQVLTCDCKIIGRNEQGHVLHSVECSNQGCMRLATRAAETKLKELELEVSRLHRICEQRKITKEDLRNDAEIERLRERVKELDGTWISLRHRAEAAEAEVKRVKEHAALLILDEAKLTEAAESKVERLVLLLGSCAAEFEAIPIRFNNREKSLSAEVFYYDIAPRWKTLVRDIREALDGEG